MALGAIYQSAACEMQTMQNTSENKSIFRSIADKSISVINSCKTFSTGCDTQKGHNIQKACERLAALTLVKPEYYTTDIMKECAEKLGMALPRDTESVNQADTSAAASIGKVSTLRTSGTSAQELYNILSKQLDKYQLSEANPSPENMGKIQATLNMVDSHKSISEIRNTEDGQIVERGVDKVKNATIFEILKQDRINEVGGGPVLEMTDILQLEFTHDIPFEL